MAEKVETGGKHKYSFWDMVTSKRSGELSATGFLGVITGLIMLIVFIAMVTYYFFNPEHSESTLDIIEQATIWFGMASALLGTRKVTGMIGSRGATIVEKVVNTTDDEEKEKESEKEIAE